MSVRKANAVWEGTLKEGKGSMNFDQFEVPYTFSTRFEEANGSNPEELIGSALAGCFSMFLAALISGEGLTPGKVETSAEVTLEKDETGPLITLIKLDNRTNCEGLDQSKFDELVATAKQNCPISRLYQGGTADIQVSASLTTLQSA